MSIDITPGLTNNNMKIYNFQCDIGMHYVLQSNYGPRKCSKCGKQGCYKHVANYGVCDACWKKMTPEAREETKKEYMKQLKSSFGISIVLFSILFGIPFATWLITKNTTILLISVFVVIVLFVIFSIKWANNYRKKNQGENYVSIGEELKSEIRSRPKIDKNTKLAILVAVGCFLSIALIIVIIAVVIMADFNSRWS